MTDESRETHRANYATLLGRVANAYRKPESVRAKNTGLLRSLETEARDERIKATSGYMHSGGALRADDPLVASTDIRFGTIADVARSIVSAERVNTAGMDTEQLLRDVLGAEVATWRPVPRPE